MSTSKKLFVVFAIVFVILLAYASYDIASRTTFPGSKPQLKQRIERDILKKDSVQNDSAQVQTGKM
jgi:hypothetical protein